MSFVLFGTVSQCCDATSILDGIISFKVNIVCTSAAALFASFLFGPDPVADCCPTVTCGNKCYVQLTLFWNVQKICSTRDFSAGYLHHKFSPTRHPSFGHQAVHRLLFFSRLCYKRNQDLCTMRIYAEVAEYWRRVWSSKVIKVIKINSVESLRTCWICMRRLMGLMLWPPSPPCSPFFTSTCCRERSTWEFAFTKKNLYKKQSLELLTLPQVTTRLHPTRYIWFTSLLHRDVNPSFFDFFAWHH